MFFVIGVAILFAGCSKDNSIAPDSIQNDQETSQSIVWFPSCYLACQIFIFFATTLPYRFVVWLYSWIEYDFCPNMFEYEVSRKFPIKCIQVDQCA